jgi:hypothetical protein
MNDINRKKIGRLVVLLLIAGILIFFILRMKGRKFIIPQFNVNPEPIGKTTYEVVKGSPEVVQTGTEYQTVYFDLNNNIDPNTSKIEIEPKADVKIRVSPENENKIVIYPVGPWEFNKDYTLKIDGKTVARFSFEKIEYENEGNGGIKTTENTKVDEKPRIPQNMQGIPWVRPKN